MTRAALLVTLAACASSPAPVRSGVHAPRSCASSAIPLLGILGGAVVAAGTYYLISHDQPTYGYDPTFINAVIGAAGYGGAATAAIGSIVAAQRMDTICEQNEAHARSPLPAIAPNHALDPPPAVVLPPPVDWRAQVQYQERRLTDQARAAAAAGDCATVKTIDAQVRAFPEVDPGIQGGFHDTVFLHYSDIVSCLAAPASDAGVPDAPPTSSSGPAPAS